jgi:hypothetical protein
VVVAADDISDAEVQVVDRRRPVVRRGAVGSKDHELGRVTGGKAHGAVADDCAGGTGRRLRVSLLTVGLAHRPLVPADAEPRQICLDRRLRTRHGARGVGVVDPQQHRAPMRGGEQPVDDGGQRAAQMQAAGGAGGESDTSGHGEMNATNDGAADPPNGRGERLPAGVGCRRWR